MLFLLLTDEGCFGNLLHQVLIFGLGVFFAVFHQLDSKGKTEEAGQKCKFTNLLLFGHHIDTGVFFPDLVMGFFFPCKTQEGFFVLIALGKGCDLFVDDAFGQFILLHTLDNFQRSGGYVFHDKNSFQKEVNRWCCSRRSADSLPSSALR